MTSPPGDLPPFYRPTALLIATILAVLLVLLMCIVWWIAFTGGGDQPNTRLVLPFIFLVGLPVGSLGLAWISARTDRARLTHRLAWFSILLFLGALLAALWLAWPVFVMLFAG